MEASRDRCNKIRSELLSQRSSWDTQTPCFLTSSSGYASYAAIKKKETYSVSSSISAFIVNPTQNRLHHFCQPRLRFLLFHDMCQVALNKQPVHNTVRYDIRFR